MSDLAESPKDRFSCFTAQISLILIDKSVTVVKIPKSMFVFKLLVTA